MGVVKSVSDLTRELECLCDREAPATRGNFLTEWLSRNVLHHKKWLLRIWIFTSVKNGYYSGVRQLSYGASFLSEAFVVVLHFRVFYSGERYRFDCYQAINLRVARTIHNSHRAASNFGF